MSAKSKVTTQRCFILTIGYGKIILPFTKANIDIVEQLIDLPSHDATYIDDHGYVFYPTGKVNVEVDEIELFNNPETPANTNQYREVVEYFKPAELMEAAQ